MQTLIKLILQTEHVHVKTCLHPSLDGDESERLRTLVWILKCNNVDLIGGSGICAEHSDHLNVLILELAAKHGINTSL